MRNKYLKITLICLTLTLTLGVIVFGTRTPSSEAANVNVQLFVPVPVCGNGIKEGDAELCDDSNIINGDGCSSTCAVEPGYTCTGSPSVCVYTMFCGNGIVDPGEQCDDSNTNNDDVCTNTCRNAVCGDNFVQTGVEQCDDGNVNNNDACTNTCRNASCGDSFLRPGVEQCDDGNAANGDGCDNECYLEVCGNGRAQLGEPCDDGNLNNGDGCSSLCAVEAGYVCSGSPSCCAVCGDGIRQCAEQCDDGKQCMNQTSCTTNADCFGIGDFLCITRSGDGCSAVCATEGGGARPPDVDIIITQTTAYPELRTGAAGANYDTKYTFSVLTPDNQNHQSVYSQSSFLYTQNSGIGYPYVTLYGVAVGTYDITLKTVAHLTTMLDNAYLIAGDNQLNFTNPANQPSIGSIVLTAGDIDNAGTSVSTLGDDVINSVDISVMLQNLGTPDATGNNIRANLNQDTIVDTADLNILLNNLDKEANF